MRFPYSETQENGPLVAREVFFRSIVCYHVKSFQFNFKVVLLCRAPSLKAPISDYVIDPVDQVRRLEKGVFQRRQLIAKCNK